MESIDNLIDTLEFLGSALSERDKNQALEAITLLSQQFRATFGHATRAFLGILYLETLKVHILGEEFEEASGGAQALLARLRAVSTATRQSTAPSAPANTDAFREDVFENVTIGEIAPEPVLPLARARGARGWGDWRRNALTVKPIRALPEYQVGWAA